MGSLLCLHTWQALALRNKYLWIWSHCNGPGISPITLCRRAISSFQMSVLEQSRHIHDAPTPCLSARAPTFLQLSHTAQRIMRIGREWQREFMVVSNISEHFSSINSSLSSAMHQAGAGYQQKIWARYRDNKKAIRLSREGTSSYSSLYYRVPHRAVWKCGINVLVQTECSAVAG